MPRSWRCAGRVRHAADQGLPALGAIVRTFPLTDRHGNAAGLVAVIPVGRG